jgi:HlyD family secretion protein
VGQRARCVLDTYPDRTFVGTVTYVAAVAEQGRDRSGFRVRVALGETDPARMRPGMSVRIEVVRASWKDALVVPRASVEWRDGRAFATRVRGGAVELRLGACTPVECVLESGLSEGERVVG